MTQSFNLKSGYDGLMIKVTIIKSKNNKETNREEKIK
jgi:hypothetical protein